MEGGAVLVAPRQDCCGRNEDDLRILRIGPYSRWAIRGNSGSCSPQIDEVAASKLEQNGIRAAEEAVARYLIVFLPIVFLPVDIRFPLSVGWIPSANLVVYLTKGCVVTANKVRYPLSQSDGWLFRGLCSKTAALIGKKQRSAHRASVLRRVRDGPRHRLPGFPVRRAQVNLCAALWCSNQCAETAVPVKGAKHLSLNARPRPLPFTRVAKVLGSGAFVQGKMLECILARHTIKRPAE